MTRLTNTEVKLKKEKTSQLYCMFNSLKMLSDWPEINKAIINQFISAIIQPQCTTKKQRLQNTLLLKTHSEELNSL